jgi:DNA replication licensing factor MCM2
MSSPWPLPQSSPPPETANARTRKRGHDDDDGDVDMGQGVPSSPPGGLPSTPNNFRSSPPLLDDDEDELDEHGGIMDLEDMEEEMDGEDLMDNMERLVMGDCSLLRLRLMVFVFSEITPKI